MNCKDLPHPEMIAMVFLFPPKNHGTMGPRAPGVPPMSPGVTLVQDSQLIESESRIKQKEARGPGPRRLPLEPSRFRSFGYPSIPCKMVSQLELRIAFFNPMIAELVTLDILMLMSMIEGVPSLALVKIWYCDVSLFHFFQSSKKIVYSSRVDFKDGNAP